MTQSRFLLCLLAFTSVVSAGQVSHPVMVSRDDAFSSPRPFMILPDTVRVLAAMVQFQTDTDQRTSGDGRFVLTAPTDSIIDAPPRNRQYFEDHLTFVRNYYRKVSKAKVIIVPTVLDTVFTLPTTMATYSPPRGGSNEAVANLARDSWLMVDAAGVVPDFSRYDCFIVFHAGVGRDIDLVSLLGYDPTPLDIPSLFFGLNGFRQYYGSTYQGIPVNGGTHHITNTIIMPETESRLLPTVTGEALLELGINGLLCASVGNFLGLPDLFDTNTGRSGIGRFGLMDGQSIFSFSGVFPPEPSAWEKYWLGWVEPIAMQAGETIVDLPAVGLDTANTIYRVPISAGEYFLIENRNRDPYRNGQTLTSTFNGVTRVQTFARDTAGFQAFDISRLAGVITDVEDVDWSIPGGVTEQGVFFDGGTLIWHIDESVIAAGLATNGVNGNPDRRGVDLEEADGSQDIGETYGFLSAGSGSEEGTPLDFWFAGNPSPVNRNEFSSTTHPNSKSNGGANSHITIKDFSTRGPRMTARVIVGDDQVSLLPGFPKTVGESLPGTSLMVADIVQDESPEIIVATTGIPVPRLQGGTITLPMSTGGKIFAWKSDGSPALSTGSSDGLFAIAGSDSTPFVSGPVVGDFNGDTIEDLVLGHRAAFSASTLRGYTAIDQNVNGLADSLFSTIVTRTVTTPPVAGDSIIAFGATGGMVYFLALDGGLIDSVRLLPDSTAHVAGVSRFAGANEFIVTGGDGTILITSRSTTPGLGTEPTRIRQIGSQIAGPAAAGIIGPSSAERIAFATTDGYVHLVDASLSELPGFPVSTGGAITESPALADIDGDGQRDIIVFSANKIHVYNFAGVSLDYFPVTVRAGEPITSAPVVADLDGDGLPDVVAATGDGLVVAYDKRGKLAPGFPLQAGSGRQSIAAFRLWPPVDIGLAVASAGDGSVTAWKTGHTTPASGPAYHPWPRFQRDARNTGFAAERILGSPLSNDFFPESRAYNWPNPVYDGRTYIRYFVRDDATVNIKVFDLAGDLVTEFPGPGFGGVDNEVEWKVKDIQSGIYFARIEASGQGGSGVAVVKVAVVK